MKRRLFRSLVCAVHLAAATIGTQSVAAGEVNVFGDDFPSVKVAPGGKRIEPSGAAQAILGDQHTLRFQDGRQLHGELAGVTSDHVLWHRSDAEEVLRIPRGEVASVVCPRTVQEPDSRGSTPKAATISEPLLATVKLPGGDWVRGAITSEDGQTFAMSPAGATPFAVPRAQISWLSYGTPLSSAYGMGAGPMAFAGWQTGGAKIESESGTVTLRQTQWIGCALSMPARLEVAFEVPAENEEGLRLWLRFGGLEGELTHDGTVQLRFGRQNLRCVIDRPGRQPDDFPLPAEASAETGPVSYRVFYDQVSQRVVVLRNGRQVAESSLRPQIVPLLAPIASKAASRPRGLRGLRFDYEALGVSHLKFRQLEVMPWSGELPDAEVSPLAVDRLKVAASPAKSGALTAVGATHLMFAGERVALDADTTVQLQPTAAAMAGAEAVASLGQLGRLSLKDLHLSDGKVRAQTVFGLPVEWPAASLQSLTFAPRKLSVPAASDTLIFKNGDEISGSLVAAESGGPVRWRLVSGQEVPFQTERIAGVRLATRSALQPAASLELRTGEWLRGAVVQCDERHLRWHHAFLGDLDLDRAQLWRLYPNSQWMPLNGSDDPETWLYGSDIAQHMVEYNPVRLRSDAWLAFDGRFIVRPREGGGRGEKVPGPTRELPAGCERFELSIDFASPGEWFGRLNVNFIGSSDPKVSVGLTGEELILYVQNAKAKDRGLSRTLSFPDKNEAGRRQFNLRAFVNGPGGTIDFFLDGRFLGRTGEAEAERLTGVIKKVSLESYAASGAQMIVSSVALRPWDGQLRPAADSLPATLLFNGDSVAGAPVALQDGQWNIESEGGRINVPADRVHAVQFGGEMQTVQAAARVRLVDGSALLVDRFRRTGDEWRAHHVVLGDLRIPAAQVSELVFNPAPVRLSPLQAKTR